MGSVRLDYFETLSDVFQRRKERNPRYSLRAYARSLGLSSSSLSCILRQKSVPSLKLADSLSKKLKLTSNQREIFLESVAEALKADSLVKIGSSLESAAPRALSVEEFQLISDWYYYAIMELTETEGFRLDPAWISKELGIPQKRAASAITRLQALQLLVKKPNGDWEKVNRPVTTLDKSRTSLAHRKRQKQILRRAIAAMDHTPLERRSMTSMTMAICPENLPKAKALILEFNRKLCRLLQEGSKVEVYELGVCLYPHQKLKKPERNSDS